MKSRISITRLSTTLLLVMAAGPTAAQTKGLFDPSTLRTFSITLTQKDWWNTLRNSKRTEAYMKADLKVDGRLFQNVGIRTRGAGSYYNVPRSSQKLPFKIKLDAFVKDQAFLGHRTLNLDNGYLDPTRLRDVIPMRIAREILPAPEAHFVRLVLNGTDWGVYGLIEPVNAAFLAKHNRNSQGYFFKGLIGFQWLGPNATIAHYKQYWPLLSDPDPQAYPTLISAYKSLATTPASKKVVEAPKQVNIDGAWRMLALNQVIGNDNGFAKTNFYIYADVWHGRLELMPWDLDVCFSSNRYVPAANPGFLGDSDLWRRRYQGHLRNLIERYLDWKVIGAWVTEYQKLIDAAVKADTKSLFPYAVFKSNVTTNYFQIGGLKPVIEERRKRFDAMPFMKRSRVSFANARHAPASPTHRDKIQVSVQVASKASIGRVVLHWRVRGWFREIVMAKAGNGVFAASIPKQKAGARVQYYFSGETITSAGGDVSYLPWRGAFRPLQVVVQPRRDSVLISECLARNKNGKRDGAGDQDDWIELWNPTSAAVNLSGLYLTDNSARPRRWTIPKGQVLPANGRLLVWADEEPGEGALHASFKLSGDGEEVALIDRDGETVLDVLAFGGQAKDVSVGQLLDQARSPVATLRQPTPGQPNGIVTCGMRSFAGADPFAPTMNLSVGGSYKIGSALSVRLTSAPQRGLYLAQAGVRPDVAPLPGLGVDNLVGAPLLFSGLLRADAGGGATVALRIPDQASAIGAAVSLQVVSHDGRRFIMSNGVEVRFCKK